MAQSTKRAGATTKTSGTTKKAVTATKAAAKKAATKASGSTATPRAAGSATAGKKVRASTKKVAAATKKATGVTKKATGVTSPRAADRRDEVHALELLMADHREVEQLFVRFEKAGKGARKQRQQLVERMTVALSQHAAIEENVLYPASRREQPTTNDDVLEALEEHHLVKLTLAELQMMDPSSERYDAKVTVLIESVRHHVKEEEKELFPQLRRSLGRDRLREIGAELVAAKRSAPTRPHPEAPDTPPTSIVVQAVTAPFDAAADLAGATAKRVRDLVT